VYRGLEFMVSGVGVWDLGFSVQGFEILGFVYKGLGFEGLWWTLCRRALSVAILTACV